MKIPSKTAGILFALMTAGISALSIMYAKLAVASIAPLTLATMRNLFVGIMFLVLFFLRKSASQRKPLSFNQIIRLLTIGILGGSLPFYLFFSGLSRIGAIEANIIHKSLFIWVALIASITLKERVSLRLIAGIIFVSAGTFMLSPVSVSLSTGSIMVLSATILWAIETIIAKKVLTDIEPELVGLFRMGLGGIILLGFSLFTDGGANIRSLTLIQIQTIFVGSTLLCCYVFLWYNALQRAPATVTTLLLTLSVPAGIFGTALITSTIPAPTQWVSAGLLISGSIIASGILKKRSLRNSLIHG